MKLKAQHTLHSAEVQSQLKERETTFEIMVQTQRNQHILLEQEAEATQRGNSVILIVSNSTIPISSKVTVDVVTKDVTSPFFFFFELIK